MCVQRLCVAVALRSPGVGWKGHCLPPTHVSDLLLPVSLQTMVLASGGQDGAICLWDVLTGSKVSHMYAHRGDVTSLTCTTSCVISSGLDDVISIWDRSSGIKLYSIQQVGSQGKVRGAPVLFRTPPDPAAHLRWAAV